MASYFVRPTNGNDGNDGLSHANAFKTMQKAIDSAAGGDRINLNDESADVLASALGWGSGWSGGTGGDTPLMIAGYTSTEGDAGIGEIDGNDAVANIFSTTSIPQSVILHQLNLHNTTGFIVDPNSRWLFFECLFEDGGGIALLDDALLTRIIRCEFDGTGSGTFCDGFELGQESIAIGNEIHATTGLGIKFVATPAYALMNLIYDTDEHGIQLGVSDFLVVIWNTIVGESISGQHGIDMSGSSVANLILSNIVKDWGTGGSGGGIDYNTTGNTWAVGFNHFHNNSEGNYLSADDKAVDFTGSDTTTDPTFADKAGGDFSVGTNAKEKGFPTGFLRGTTTIYFDSGAVQRQEPASASIIVMPRGMPHLRM